MIGEHKTTARTPKQPAPGDTLQTCAYAQGYRIDAGELEAGVRIDYAVKLKSPKIVSFERKVENTEIEFFNRLLNQIVKGIESEFWLPNRQAITCSRRWCGFWSHCMSDWGGTVKE